MRRMSTALLITGAIVLGACGGDDDSSEPDESSADEPAADEPATDEPAAEEPAAEEPAAEEPAAEEAAAEPADEPAVEEPAEEPAAPSGGGSGTATLTLDNGETFEFGVLCTLEPQEAAGSEIVFTATSYDDPGLDITQFGAEGSGTVTDVATVSVYDGSYNTLWEASNLYEPFGGGVELSLDGSTINGTGTFFAGGDPVTNPDGVAGTVEARCG